MPGALPVIDLARHVAGASDASTARALHGACRDLGFFYAVGHGVPPELPARLEALGRAFFALPLERKLEVRMELGGRAWRGYFPVGAELTSGVPDEKEGLYFGAELEDDHPRVRSGAPLHGRNLFPDLPGFRDAVLEYLEVMTRLGQAVMRAIAESLGLEPGFFERRYTREPLVLLRLFSYPPLAPGGESASRWSVAEHTDYGLLTLLHQDDRGGLEVEAGGRWIPVPPVAGSFVCNLGDMLDRMTGGLYRSTPHRVRNLSGRARTSIPFFFDPGWDAAIEPLEFPGRPDHAPERWDGARLFELDGTYGEYLVAKVRRVFPALGEGLEPPTWSRGGP